MTDTLWTDQPRMLADLAGLDLEDGSDVRPTLVAFRGDDPLLLATIRPFARGEHHQPIIEVVALALGLGARRMALSLAGRAWSTRDPLPPVVEGVGDLRERVVVVHTVDAEVIPTQVRSLVHPVGPDGLDEPVVDAGAVGWVPDVLRHAAEAPVMPEGELLTQVARCEALGHQLAWGPAGVALLQGMAGFGAMG